MNTTITTKSGYEITCDPEDSDLLYSRKWYVNKSGTATQARSDSPVKGTYLHRLIAERMKPADKISKIESIDGCGLNCKRDNLRIHVEAEILLDQIVFCDGRVGLFDKEDRATVISFKPWTIFDDQKGHQYVRQSGSNGKFLHRILTNCPSDLVVDHINNNGLDNRLSVNLRIATDQQNAGNAKINSRNKSGYRGVSFIKSHGKWRASIKENGSIRTIGEFNTREEAARAYDEAAKRVFGTFANLNFPAIKKAA